MIPPQFVRSPANLPTPQAAPVPQMLDHRQTLVDLTPATNWTPPTVVHAKISDDPEPEAAPKVAAEKLVPANHKSAAGDVQLASATANIFADAGALAVRRRTAGAD